MRGLKWDIINIVHHGTRKWRGRGTGSKYMWPAKIQSGEIMDSENWYESTVEYRNMSHTPPGTLRWLVWRKGVRYFVIY